MHAAEDPLAPAAKSRMALPANVLGEKTSSIDSGNTAEVSQRREALHPTFTEQFPAGPLDLGTPDDEAQNYASNETGGERRIRCAPAHIALRAANA
jgi:hypothetical protein